MADRLKLAFPSDPRFGSGATRRRIRLDGAPGIVRGRITDSFHDMSCTLQHDGAIVTAVDGRMRRFPNTACPAAPAMLAELVGLPVGAGPAEIFAPGRARRNCTHLFDLAALAVTHAGRGAIERVYDAVVEDDTGDKPVRAQVQRDGRFVHDWRIRDGQIVTPPELAGRTVLSGFTAWASEVFTRDEFEAAAMLARVCFLAQGRRYDTDALIGLPLRSNGQQTGVCYAYSEERLDSALFLGGNVRDFSTAIDLEDGADRL